MIRDFYLTRVDPSRKWIEADLLRVLANWRGVKKNILELQKNHKDIFYK